MASIIIEHAGIIITIMGGLVLVFEGIVGNRRRSIWKKKLRRAYVHVRYNKVMFMPYLGLSIFIQTHFVVGGCINAFYNLKDALMVHLSFVYAGFFFIFLSYAYKNVNLLICGMLSICCSILFSIMKHAEFVRTIKDCLSLGSGIHFFPLAYGSYASFEIIIKTDLDSMILWFCAFSPVISVVFFTFFYIPLAAFVGAIFLDAESFDLKKMLHQNLLIMRDKERLIQATAHAANNRRFPITSFKYETRLKSEDTYISLERDKTAQRRLIYFTLLQDNCLLASLGVSLSFALTIASFSIGRYFITETYIPAYPSMLFANLVFDALTVVVTFKIFLFLLGQKRKIISAISLDLLLAAIFAVLSLYLGTIQDDFLNLRFIDAISMLIGYNMRSHSWDFGAIFWAMHTAFIPSAIYILIIAFMFFIKLIYYIMSKILAALRIAHNPVGVIGTSVVLFGCGLQLLSKYL